VASIRVVTGSNLGRNTEFCMDFNSPLPFASFEICNCLGPIIGC